MALSDLELAVRELHSHRHSVVAVKDGRCLGAEAGPGVAPFLRLVAGAGNSLQGAALADRVVGRAVALACVHLGVAAVYGDLASQGALAALGGAAIPARAGQVVPYIANRLGTGPCPTEDLVSGVADPAQALPLLQGFVRGGPRPGPVP